MDLRLEVAPQCSLAITGFESQRFGQAAIQIEPPEVGFGLVYHLVRCGLSFPVKQRKTAVLPMQASPVRRTMPGDQGCGAVDLGRLRDRFDMLLKRGELATMRLKGRSLCCCGVVSITLRNSKGFSDLLSPTSSRIHSGSAYYFCLRIRGTFGLHKTDGRNKWPRPLHIMQIVTDQLAPRGKPPFCLDQHQKCKKWGIIGCARILQAF